MLMKNKTMLITFIWMKKEIKNFKNSLNKHCWGKLNFEIF